MRPSQSQFNKRSETLKKITAELAELCGIKTMMICFGPNQELVTWPTNKQELEEIIEKYRNLSPDKANKYKLSSSSQSSMAIINHVSDEELRSLDAKLQEVNERIEAITHIEEEEEEKAESGEATDEDESAPRTRNFIANIDRVRVEERPQNDDDDHRVVGDGDGCQWLQFHAISASTAAGDGGSPATIATGDGDCAA